MSRTNCPFCDLKERVVQENEYAHLFLSNPRKVPGHLLAAPKRHVEKPWKLEAAELQAIFELVFFAQRRLSEGFSQGVDIRQNYRPFMPQSRLKVDHVHYHVMPRNDKDELFEEVEQHETALFKELPEDEKAAIIKLLQ